MDEKNQYLNRNAAIDTLIAAVKNDTTANVVVDGYRCVIVPMYFDTHKGKTRYLFHLTISNPEQHWMAGCISNSCLKYTMLKYLDEFKDGSRKIIKTQIGHFLYLIY